MLSTLNEEKLHALSCKYSLALRTDVFHSSAGYEFRKKMADGCECVGVVIGPVESEIYQRKLPKRYILFRERFWWLGFLFGRGFNIIEYTPVKKIPTNELREETIECAIRRYLLKIES